MKNIEKVAKLRKDIISGKYVAEYIRRISTDLEMVPEPWLIEYVEPNLFFLSTLYVEEVITSDPEVERFIFDNKYRPRYIWSDRDGFYFHDAGWPEPEVVPADLYNPIVVVDGKVIDGYSRLATLYYEGESTVEAFVAFEK